MPQPSSTFSLSRFPICYCSSTLALPITFDESDSSPSRCFLFALPIDLFPFEVSSYFDFSLLLLYSSLSRHCFHSSIQEFQSVWKYYFEQKFNYFEPNSSRAHLFNGPPTRCWRCRLIFFSRSKLFALDRRLSNPSLANRRNFSSSNSTRYLVSSDSATSIRLRIKFLGARRVGKSSLIERISSGRFNPNSPSSLTTQFHALRIADPTHSSSDSIKIEIWDSGPDEILFANQSTEITFKPNLNSLDSVALCFALDESESIATLRILLKSWQTQIAGRSVILVGTKSDRRVVDRAEVASLTEEFGLPVVETSALTGENELTAIFAAVQLALKLKFEPENNKTRSFIDSTSRSFARSRSQSPIRPRPPVQNLLAPSSSIQKSIQYRNKRRGKSSGMEINEFSRTTNSQQMQIESESDSDQSASQTSGCIIV